MRRRGVVGSGQRSIGDWGKRPTKFILSLPMGGYESPPSLHSSPAVGDEKKIFLKSPLRVAGMRQCARGSFVPACWCDDCACVSGVLCAGIVALGCAWLCACDAWRLAATWVGEGSG